LKLRSVRMGRWKEAVSIAQRARKKRYCRRIGWEASAFEGLSVLFGAPDWEVALVRPDVKGGGGVSGRAGDEGVAFSMRAHVR
jgi:hypothetical protein